MLMDAGWSNAFIGLPWKQQGSDRDGVWCWGLVALAYREVKGIELPTYTGSVTSSAERAEIAAIMASDSAAYPWRKIEDRERPLDVAMFRRGRDLAHVGVVVRPGLMLHINEERGGEPQTSRLDSYRTGEWKARLVGIYRHAGLDT